MLSDVLHPQVRFVFDAVGLNLATASKGKELNALKDIKTTLKMTSKNIFIGMNRLCVLVI